MSRPSPASVHRWMTMASPGLPHDYNRRWTPITPTTNEFVSNPTHETSVTLTCFPLRTRKPGACNKCWWTRKSTTTGLRSLRWTSPTRARRANQPCACAGLGLWPDGRKIVNRKSKIVNPPKWYPHPELNRDQRFRKPPLYPFELWGQGPDDQPRRGRSCPDVYTLARHRGQTSFGKDESGLKPRNTRNTRNARHLLPLSCLEDACIWVELLTLFLRRWIYTHYTHN